MQVIKLNNCIWTFFKGVIQASALPGNQFIKCYQTLPSAEKGGKTSPWVSWRHGLSDGR